MTTTVTVKTHTWPVAVESSSNYSSEGPTHCSFSHGYSTEFVPANSEKSFAVTDTTSITVRELPADAVDLGNRGEIASEAANQLA